MEQVIPGEWLRVFTGVNVSVIMSIGVIAFLLEYSHRISDGWAMVLPLILGALWGALSSSAERVADGQTLIAHVVAGVLINGAAGSVFGRAVTVALRKYFKATEEGNGGLT